MRVFLFGSAVLFSAFGFVSSASAQVFKCTDANGRVVYTNSACSGAKLVVPELSAEQKLANERASKISNERALQRRLDNSSNNPAPVIVNNNINNIGSSSINNDLALSAQCAAARKEADFRARSFSANSEQIKTARYNAALACGQTPPAEVNSAPVIINNSSRGGHRFVDTNRGIYREVYNGGYNIPQNSVNFNANIQRGNFSFGVSSGAIVRHSNVYQRSSYFLYK